MTINFTNDSIKEKNISFSELIKSLYSINEKVLDILWSYDWVLDFKSKIINWNWVNYIKSLADWEEILNDIEKWLVDKYKIELSESAVYWTPVNETEEQKEKLILWEQLFNVVNNVNKILIIK